MNREYLYNKKKNTFKYLIVFIIIILAITGGGILYYRNLLEPLNTEGEEKTIEIPPGYSVKAISKLLEEERIIKKDIAFILAVKMENVGGQLQSGKYLLSPSMGTKEVIYRIAGGQAIDDSIKVTIPEGFNINMIAERLEEKGLTTKEKFLEVANDIAKFNYSFLKTISEDRENPLEGYLFPDTYSFYDHVSEEDIINAMLKRFDEVFSEEFALQAEKLEMSIDDIVILSSIIEQETKFDIDRPEVAGVFYNRLKIDMALQSDVTVLYALGEKKEQVLFKDLEVDSKYNTYKYTGLPIGPIGSFGLSSLKAALYPEENDYLYFIAKSDGYCVFNETYDEHMKDKKKYLD